MYFLNEDDNLLEKYNTISDKVRADIKKEFFNNQKLSKTKIESYGDEVIDFYDKKISNADSNRTCLAVISLDSAFKKDENYYPLVFLKECKYIKKEKKDDQTCY